MNECVNSQYLLDIYSSLSSFFSTADVTRDLAGSIIAESAISSYHKPVNHECCAGVNCDHGEDWTKEKTVQCAYGFNTLLQCNAFVHDDCMTLSRVGIVTKDDVKIFHTPVYCNAHLPHNCFSVGLHEAPPGFACVCDGDETNVGDLVDCAFPHCVSSFHSKCHQGSKFVASEFPDPDCFEGAALNALYCLRHLPRSCRLVTLGDHQPISYWNEFDLQRHVYLVGTPDPEWSNLRQWNMSEYFKEESCEPYIRPLKFHAKTSLLLGLASATDDYASLGWKASATGTVSSPWRDRTRFIHYANISGDYVLTWNNAQEAIDCEQHHHFRGQFVTSAVDELATIFNEDVVPAIVYQRGARDSRYPVTVKIDTICLEYIRMPTAYMMSAYGSAPKVIQAMIDQNLLSEDCEIFVPNYPPLIALFTAHNVERHRNRKFIHMVNEYIDAKDNPLWRATESAIDAHSDDNVVPKTHLDELKNYDKSYPFVRITLTFGVQSALPSTSSASLSSPLESSQCYLSVAQYSLCGEQPLLKPYRTHLPRWVPQRVVSFALFDKAGVETLNTIEANIGFSVWATEFSNVHDQMAYDEPDIQLEVNGEVYGAGGSEVFFQSMKSYETPTHSAVMEQMRRMMATNPRSRWPALAYEIGRAGALRADWDIVKVKVMNMAVRAKFAARPELTTLLMSTGNLPLVQIKFDDFWGTGADGNGQNQLGKILMKVRAEAIASGGQRCVASFASSLQASSFAPVRPSPVERSAMKLLIPGVLDPIFERISDDRLEELYPKWLSQCLLSLKSMPVKHTNGLMRDDVLSPQSQLYLFVTDASRIGQPLQFGVKSRIDVGSSTLSRSNCITLYGGIVRTEYDVHTAVPAMDRRWMLRIGDDTKQLMDGAPLRNAMVTAVPTTDLELRSLMSLPPETWGIDQLLMAKHPALKKLFTSGIGYMCNEPTKPAKANATYYFEYQSGPGGLGFKVMAIKSNKSGGCIPKHTEITVDYNAPSIHTYDSIPMVVRSVLNITSSHASFVACIDYSSIIHSFTLCCF